MGVGHGNGRCRIGIDVGGTFTDFVLVAHATGTITRYKEPSVPADPSASVAEGIEALLARARVQPEDVELVVHGTTLLVNAVIQRRGARVALVVSRGNRGVLEIGRANLASSVNYKQQKEEPLVPRDLVFETAARVMADGTVFAEPAAGEIEDIAERIRRCGVDAVAVMLVNSYAHPELERRVADELRRHLGGIPVTESAHIWPERREYERATVAILNAYVQPLMDDYLRRLEERMRTVGVRAPIYITTNNGGTVSVETARRRPIDTMLSGPASGVMAAIRAADASGWDRLVTVDMGGTSCDVAVTRGSEAEYTSDTHVGGVPLMLPVVNVSAIGAGGGSVVWVDSQGVLKVGPRSVGADPGPACYGRGGEEATVTDCYLLVGYLHPEHFLGGRMPLVPGAARAALERVGERLSIAGTDRAVRAAAAALRVATTTMTTELAKGLARRGEDPRDFALMAYGGAGPTHANLLAEDSDIPRVILPAAASTFCALGAALADIMRDYVHCQHLKLDEGEPAIAALRAILRGLEREAAAWMAAEGELLGRPRFVFTAAMRYAGQAFELEVAIPDRLRRRPTAGELAELFHREHERIYGFRDLESAVEMTTQRLRVVGRLTRASLPEAPPSAGAAPVGRRRVRHDGADLEVPAFRRRDLGHGDTIPGPAIVEQDDSTAWVLPGWTAAMDAAGNLVLSRPR